MFCSKKFVKLRADKIQMRLHRCFARWPKLDLNWNDDLDLPPQAEESCWLVFTEIFKEIFNYLEYLKSSNSNPFPIFAGSTWMDEILARGVLCQINRWVILFILFFYIFYLKFFGTKCVMTKPGHLRLPWMIFSFLHSSTLFYLRIF